MSGEAVARHTYIHTYVGKTTDHKDTITKDTNQHSQDGHTWYVSYANTRKPTTLHTTTYNHNDKTQATRMYDMHTKRTPPLKNAPPGTDFNSTIDGLHSSKSANTKQHIFGTDVDDIAPTPEQPPFFSADWHSRCCGDVDLKKTVLQGGQRGVLPKEALLRYTKHQTCKRHEHACCQAISPTAKTTTRHRKHTQQPNLHERVRRLRQLGKIYRLLAAPRTAAIITPAAQSRYQHAAGVGEDGAASTYIPIRTTETRANQVRTYEVTKSEKVDNGVSVTTS